jgi:hypothetical protein
MSDRPLSQTARILIAMLSIGGGTIPMLAAFDVGPLRATDIHGPPWIGFVAGGLFILAGLGVLAGNRLRHGPVGYAFVVLVLCAFAALGNWIAFGPGPRQCEIVAAGFVFDSASPANQIACRIGFGIGALILDGFLLVLAGRALRHLMTPMAARIPERAGTILLFLGLAPILAPFLLYLIARSLVLAWRTYRQIGQWPRNEAFIARMKQKRADPG